MNIKLDIYHLLKITFAVILFLMIFYLVSEHMKYKTIVDNCQRAARGFQYPASQNEFNICTLNADY